MLGQPGVELQQLLRFGLRAGCFDSLHRLLSLRDDLFAIIINAKLIAIQEVHDHAGQVVVGVAAVTHVFQRHVGKDQHLAQNAEAVLTVVVAVQVEGQLQAENVLVRFPEFQILPEHIQDGVDLILGQRLFGFLRSIAFSHHRDTGGFVRSGGFGIGFAALNHKFAQLIAHGLQDRIIRIFHFGDLFVGQNHLIGMNLTDLYIGSGSRRVNREGAVTQRTADNISQFLCAARFRRRRRGGAGLGFRGRSRGRGGFRRSRGRRGCSGLRLCGRSRGRGGFRRCGFCRRLCLYRFFGRRRAGFRGFGCLIGRGRFLRGGGGCLLGRGGFLSRGGFAAGILRRQRRCNAGAALRYASLLRSRNGRGSNTKRHCS